MTSLSNSFQLALVLQDEFKGKNYSSFLEPEPSTDKYVLLKDTTRLKPVAPQSRLM